MSVATALNLAIGIVNENPGAVRSITRSLPLDELKGLTSATCMLTAAVELREKKAVYKAFESIEQFLMVCEPGHEWPAARIQAWYEGISLVEEQIDYEMEKIRRELEQKQ